MKYVRVSLMALSLPFACSVHINASMWSRIGNRIKQPLIQLNSAIKHYGWKSGLNKQLSQECENKTPDLSKMKTLLEQGADVHYGYKGKQPLYRTAHQGHVAASALLLKHGADPNGFSGTFFKRNPLYASTWKRHSAVTELLLQAGADPYVRSRCDSPIERAAEYRSFCNDIHLFAKHGVPLSTSIWSPGSAVSAAGFASMAATVGVVCLHPTSASFLLPLAGCGGALLNMFPLHRQTALHIAAKEGNQEAVEALLIHGADPKALDFRINTPHDVAVSAEIKQLIERYSQENVQDLAKQNLLFAARSGDLKRVRLLLAAGVTVDARNANGYTPLIWAAKQGHRMVVRELLTSGAATEVRDNNGCTPLIWAAKQGHDSTVSVLVYSGKVVVDAVDNNGNTALIMAVIGGHLEVVTTLLVKDAKVDHANNVGETALKIASKKGYHDIVEILKLYGPKDTKSSYSRSSHSWSSYWRSSSGYGVEDALQKLGLDSEERDWRTIKNAYYKLVLKYHPDKHRNASDAQRKAVEDTFREIKEAYEHLEATIGPKN